MPIISSYKRRTPANDDYVLGVKEVDNVQTTSLFEVSAIKVLPEIALVLSSEDTTNQVPSGLDTALQVKFGPATGTSADPVVLAADGVITFNVGGTYLFNGFGNFERQGSSGGVSVTAFRALLNGVQVSPTKAVELDTPGFIVPYELTIPITVEAGDELTWEIMRDSSGVDQGGLYTHTMLGGWSNVPSADVRIFQLRQAQ